MRAEPKPTRRRGPCLSKKMPAKGASADMKKAGIDRIHEILLGV